MKKLIFLCAVLLSGVIFNHSFSMDPSRPPGSITSLIINANVTVVLVNGSDAKLRLEGNKHFSDHVQLRLKGKKLVIGNKKNLDLKSGGVVYVPAEYLDYIMINSNASVRTSTPLQTSRLDVVINGACEVNLATTGELNLFETDYYTFVHTTEVVKRYVPAINKKGK